MVKPTPTAESSTNAFGADLHQFLELYEAAYGVMGSNSSSRSNPLLHPRIESGASSPPRRGGGSAQKLSQRLISLRLRLNGLNNSL